MLIDGIVAAVVVTLVAAAALLLRRSQDDVHSVEHYHRQLHTLEEIRSHPSVGGDVEAGAGAGAGHMENGTSQENGTSEEAYPASAFRVSGTRTVRLTDRETPTVLPAPPLAVPNPAEPVTFDDTGAARAPDGAGGDPPEVPSTSFMRGDGDKALHSIERRPRRLGAPLAAIGAVTVLVIVLIVTGLHTDSKPPRHGSSSTATSVPGHASTTLPSDRGTSGNGRGHPPRLVTTTTMAPPAVSAPTVASAHAATYDVTSAAYSLSLAAPSGECWVEAENPATRTVLFTGTLLAGQSHIVAASGPVVVIAGAPAAFAATINGAPVTLPPGYQAPFTLTFQTPLAGGTATPTTTPGTATTPTT